MTNRRLVFVDVDGTLIDADHRLAPGALDAVRAARAKGHLVVVATGRSRSEIPQQVIEIGFDGVVSAGGGFVEWGGALVATHTLEPTAVREITEILDAHGFEYQLQGFHRVHASAGLVDVLASIPDGAEAIPTGEWATLGPGGTNHSGPIDLGAVHSGAVHSGAVHSSAIDSSAVAKVLFVGPAPGSYDIVKNAIGDRFHVITGSIPRLVGFCGEITAPGVTKATAVIDVTGRLGIGLDRVVAIGDSVNDVEMFDIAGTAVAMADAPPDVRVRANTITGSVGADGVAAALARLGLV